MKVVFRLTLFCLFLLASPVVYTQILINEVCPDNDAILLDEFGLYPDWIELHNTSTQTVSLGGYYLSDDGNEPTKWRFPNVSLEGDQYLVIFASKRDDAVIDFHTNFKLSKHGEEVILSNPDGSVHDRINVPFVDVDKSYGRSFVDPNVLLFFGEPTPGLPNNDASSFEYNDPPDFSTEESYFIDSVLVALISHSANATIRYTTDGSIPTDTSLVYSDSILVDSTMCIRARTFSSDALPSTEATKTFFIDEEHSLPVIAISTHPDNLWSWEKGLLVIGPNADTTFPYYGANYWSEEEISVGMEYFENGLSQASFHVGLKIHGGTSARNQLMKPFRLIGDTEHGDDVMSYPFFEHRENHDYERLILRNSGGDFNYAHFRSGHISQHCINEGLHIDALSYKPVIVYLNGEYYGVMNLREKTGKQYLEQHYGVKEGDLDLLEEDTLVINGSFEIFDSMLSIALREDMTDPKVYNNTVNNFDVNNLMDYVTIETFVNNTDWPNNNLKYWREKKTGEKWRYILFDTDAAMARFPFTRAFNDVFGDMMDSNKFDQNKMVSLFKALLKNESFKNDFLNRYADLLNTSFQEEYFLQVTESVVDEIDLSMIPHFQKWGWPGHDKWHSDRLTEIYEFIMERPSYARAFLMDYFDLSNEVNLTLSVFPQDGGQVKINTISPNVFPWSGFYFNGVPVELTPEPGLGYEFSHWELPSSSQKIEDHILVKNFSSDTEVRAVFIPEKLDFSVQVIPNPIVDIGRVILELASAKKVAILTYNAIGEKINEQQFNILSAGKHTLELKTDNLLPGYYQIVIRHDEEVMALSVVKN